ncbi:4924_t:CDS:2 [Paraglomus brasilianum]|uniref:4924_t:CDS:1 n=1 Tax=Paraglomus brasilianum TaxID=144538 RepID=A0A9N9CI14_9GLOM|nr:4924_t:CDS:2 [Paraglomus brasilianum]
MDKENLKRHAETLKREIFDKLEADYKKLNKIGKSEELLEEIKKCEKDYDRKFSDLAGFINSKGLSGMVHIDETGKFNNRKLKLFTKLKKKHNLLPKEGQQTYQNLNKNKKEDGRQVIREEVLEKGNEKNAYTCAECYKDKNDEGDEEELKKEFQEYLRKKKSYYKIDWKEIGKENKKNWKNITKEFTEELQAEWEERGFTYNECKEEDYENELSAEEEKERKTVNAQEWLDRNYPKNGTCSLSSDRENYGNNLLSDTNFLSNLNAEKLKVLSIHSNNFSKQDLEFLSQFTNLEELYLDNSDEDKFNQGIYNCFTGSLEPLQNLTKLQWLSIAKTDIDHGLEYLPEKLEKSTRITGVTEQLIQEEENEPQSARIKKLRKKVEELEKKKKELLIRLSELEPPEKEKSGVELSPRQEQNKAKDLEERLKTTQSQFKQFLEAYIIEKKEQITKEKDNDKLETLQEELKVLEDLQLAQEMEVNIEVSPKNN